MQTTNQSKQQSNFDREKLTASMAKRL